ncbi:HDIG domain-containing protein [Cohnella endophytica]|uniref:HDIG domain-containing protein n=1 Tax=Cohnella endophytica TaxID=2419778 RepID=A0A494Y3Y9_9BACL|nr:HDIG domain-containing metalloprotein [Cohnella endophytica]RKP55221.1 HDIG domain-containing protein [Cohnella endophytica]
MSRKINGQPSNPLTLSGAAAGWKQSAAMRWLLLLLFVFLFYFSVAPRLVPETYDITLNGKSEKDIRAPRQELDEKATLQAQEEAAEKVAPIYSIVALRNEALIDDLFTRIEELNLDDQITETDKVDIFRRVIPERVQQYVENFVAANKGSETYSEGLLAEMQKVVQSQSYAIPEETFYKIPRLTATQLQEMRPVGKDIVRKLTGESLTQAETARTKVAEFVNASSLSLKTEREIVQELARIAILPNKFYDKQATEEAKVEAKQNTQPVLIKQGDIVVKAGQVITQNLYEKLDSLGLLKERKNYLPQLGVLLFAIIFTLALYGYGELTAASSASSLKRTNVQWVMLLLIFALNLLFMHLVALTHSSDWPYVGYLAPIAMGSMLVTLLLDVHLGLVSSFLFTLMASMILNVEQEHIFDFHYGFVAAVVSFTAVLSIHRASQRSSILKAGIMVSLFGSVAVLALMLVSPEPSRTALVQSVIFMLSSGLLTAVLVIGLMPFFEVTFGILSALKLVELSNPNHPLLRKLLTETPGTYHHSLMVGNLSEAAAESVGANGLLCRVGSFYHDVGKTKRPLYFIENQNASGNPHDKLDPKVSASIIIAHAKDGADMLKAHKLPKPIRDIAEQHHGTTFLKYFYYKAVKQAQEQGVENEWTEDDYRYPGPKAQSKEAAIVGIADCVEAAVRSLNHPKVEQIEDIIGKIIKDRLDDNQFNECDLTLRELDKIAETLKETVIGMFHSRIEYPDDKEMKKLKETKEIKHELTAGVDR